VFGLTEGIAMAARRYVNEMLENYMLALAGLDQCPESAAEAIKERLSANIERAERAFADAAADGLQSDAAVICQTVHRLSHANEVSRAGFHDGKAIGELLADLEQATEHAESVLRTARG